MSAERYFGVMDCNNFFVSCERVFNPGLEGKPVVVLSNNDGCAVSRSQEAKALGIKMGTPAFKIAQEYLSKGINVQMCSSNYTLYADMSRRVMRILRSIVGEVEVYSIDESFIEFIGMDLERIKTLSREIVEKVARFTGIPVCVGVAKTKTLAKVANKFAKKYPGYRRFCFISTEEQRLAALKLMPAEDVWGIGYRTMKRFNTEGIKTAYDFTCRHPYWIKKTMGVCGLRVYEELNGRSVISLGKAKDKKSITTSRSFGTMVESIEQLQTAVSNFATSCAQKLRAQSSAALYATVYLMTNPFREDLPQYFNSAVVEFPQATSSSLELVEGTLSALDKIYLPGFKYKKAGVLVSGIVPNGHIQQNLYYEQNTEKLSRIDLLMDDVNRRWGKGALHLAVQGNSALYNLKRNEYGVTPREEEWEMRREHLSGNYTTNLQEVITVRC